MRKTKGGSGGVCLGSSAEMRKVRRWSAHVGEGLRRGGGGGGGGGGGRNLKIYENVDEAFRSGKRLRTFEGIIKDEQITFSNTLTNHERRYVHALAGNLGLVSKSYGKGATRYLTVRRTKKFVNPDLLIPDRITFSEQEEAAMAKFQAAYPRADAISEAALSQPGGGLVKATSRHGSVHRGRKPSREAPGGHVPLDPSKTPLHKQRSALPAWEFRDAVVDTLSRKQVLIVAGETGCGKSTQVPQFILDSIPAGRPCNVVVTQPRRISAMGLAERVANERGERVGVHVGFTVRLESKRSQSTELLFCTTGVMLRMLAGDPSLSGITHVVIDEVHERDRNSDFLLIIMRRLLVRRPELKLVLMSATMQRSLFEDYFRENGVETIAIKGRTFPVTQFFLGSVLAQTKFLGKVAIPQDTEAKKALLNVVKTEKAHKAEDSNDVGKRVPDKAKDTVAWDGGDDTHSNDESAVLENLLGGHGNANEPESNGVNEEEGALLRGGQRGE